jgi:CRISPR system Cascade subunit CasC
MFVELHVIQNFSPANLNRDDTNSPKDAVFGGFRRARISSQCFKRAVRTYMAEKGLLPEDTHGIRTKRILSAASEYLEKMGKTAEEAGKVLEEGLAQLNIMVASDGKTQYLLYLSKGAVEEFANTCLEHWDVLVEASAKREKGKKKVKSTLDKKVLEDLRRLLDGKRAADIAMFGRMLADIPDVNVDAACQVAHAISANEVAMEMDFFTAVDDLNPAEETGAGMMGVVEFNSSCFYRYATVDWEQLLVNLGNDIELAANALAAFTEAFVKAIPSGKQNSMAAHNPPSYIRVHIRDSGEPWNLANAFLSPVRAGRGDANGMDALAEQRLEDYFQKLVSVYGQDGFRKSPMVAAIRLKNRVSLADLLAELRGLSI